MKKRNKRKRFDLHRGVYVLPNFVTSLNLFFGFFALISAINGDFIMSAVCVMIAGVLDNLDGKIARATKTTSRFGVEYDSLADLISFGLAPGILMYLWALKPLGRMGWLAAFLFVVCGALRLARFNTQSGTISSEYFVGLPIPAGAGMAVTTVLFYDRIGLCDKMGHVDSEHLYVMLVLVYCLSFLMVSTVKYNSFKKPKFLRHKNFHVLVAAILFLICIALDYQITLFLVGIIYVLSGPVMALYRRARPVPDNQPEQEIEKSV